MICRLLDHEVVHHGKGCVVLTIDSHNDRVHFSRKLGDVIICSNEDRLVGVQGGEEV